MRKSILKHILFVVILATIITAYLLYLFCEPGYGYHIMFFWDYVFLIFCLTNTFYFKRNSGFVIRLLTGIGSCLCFFPLIVFGAMYVNREALPRILVIVCVLLFLINFVYVMIKIFVPDQKISLMPYTIFMLVSILMLSLGYLCMLSIMFSQGT